MNGPHCIEPRRSTFRRLPVRELGPAIMSRQDHPSAPSSGRMSPAELQHHETRFLKALELLVKSGKARTVEDLIRYAVQDRQDEAAHHLRNLAAEGLPVDLAFDSLSVHVRIVAHKRNSQLLTVCQGKKVGLVMPLPPHVIDAFSSLADVTLLVPDGHHLPPHLRRAEQARQGSRAAREAVASLDVIVFEACAARQGHCLDAGAADVVDPRIVPAEAKLILHLRPHKNPNDVPLAIDAARLNVL